MFKLRPATIDDLKTLKRWDEAPHVIASDPNDDWNWETELKKTPEWREQWMAEVDGKPIGFMEIIDPALEEEHYWGDIENDLRAIDIWIGEADYLGKGYGTLMMNTALENIFKNPSIKAVLVDPLANNTRAHRFYEKFGFKVLQRRQFGPDDCLIYRLERADWEKYQKKKINPHHEI